MEDRVVPAHSVALGPSNLNLGNLGPNHSAQVGNTLYFLAGGGSGSPALWQTNGTPGGTAAVSASGLSGLNVSELIGANGALYFVAGRTTPGMGSDNVYKLDPAAPGGVAGVTQFSPNQGYVDMETLGGRLYFTQSAVTAGLAIPATQALYTVNGSSATRLTTFAGSNGIATLGGAVALNGKVYFTANDYSPRIGGVRVWVSDGTAAGTRALTGPGTSITGSLQFVPATVGNRLFLISADGAGHNKLWQTDGSTVGMIRAFDHPFEGEVGPSGISGIPGLEFTAGGDGKLYFTADDGGGISLWSSDGTAAGTRKVFDPSKLPAGFQFDSINHLTAFGGAIYFAASATAYGQELWRTDGAGGAVLVRDFRPGAGSSFPAVRAADAGGVWFTADDGLFGSELWVTNGTAGGTRRVTDLSPGIGWSGISDVFKVGSNLMIEGTDGGTATIGVPTTPVVGLPPTRLWQLPDAAVPDGASTITSLAAPAGATPGQPLLLTATVTAPGGGTPTGTVLFRDTWTIFGSAPVSNGQASVTLNNFIFGQRVIQAVYLGDTTFASSASAPAPVSVSLIPNTLSLVTSAATVGIAQNVTFTARPTPATVQPLTPVGSVTFFDGGTYLVTALVTNGAATYSTSTLSPGSHTITAAYAGDAAYAASVSTPLSQTIGAASPVSLTGPGLPTPYGQAVTFTAHVTLPSPRGSVTFKDGSTILGVVNPDANGDARLTVAALSVGTHIVTAVYHDTTDIPSAPITQAVVKGGTTTSLTTSAPTVQANQNLTLTANVAASATGLAPVSGTVTFSEFGQAISTVPVVNGRATLTINSLAAGSHLITATYSGDTNFATSVSAAINQQVSAPAPTTSATTLATSAALAATGQAVTFTATVSNFPASVATTVAFKDGSTVLATVPLSGTGTATYTTSSLSKGTHAVTAAFSGGGSVSASTSAALTQVVLPATTTALTATATSPTVGQAVTLTATVATTIPGNGTPSGSVLFLDGGTPLGTAPLQNGVATLSSTALALGTHSLTALYGANAQFFGSNSTPVSVTVRSTTGTVASATALATSAALVATGQAVTFTATVTNFPAGVATTVTFKDGSTVLATVSLSNTGTASYSTSSLSKGAHAVTASFNGGGNVAASTSAALTQVVLPATATALTASATSPTAGQAVTLTATVSAPTAGSGVPTGSVQFLDGGTSLGTVTLQNGVATLSTTTLALGTHNLMALYGANAQFFGSSSAPVSVTVRSTTGTVASTTTLATSAALAAMGQSVTITATVSNFPAGVATTVTFKDGSTVLATVPLSSTGTASYSTSTLSRGAHTVTASFSGGGNVAASTSAALTQVVLPATTTALAASATSPTAGQTVTLTAIVSATTAGSGVPTGSVQFLDGGTPLGTVTLQNGVATLSTTTLALGTHKVTALYGVNSQFLGSSSGQVTVNVSSATTTSATVTTLQLPTAVLGQSATLKAVVTATAPGSAKATGTVTFKDGGTVLGTASLVNGVASLPVTWKQGPGPHSITASYAGTATFAASASPAQTLTLQKSSAMVVLRAYPASSVTSTGQTLTLRAYVETPGNWTLATGSFTFRDGTKVLGTVSILGTTTLVTLANVTLSPGTHTLTAEYTGNNLLLSALGQFPLTIGGPVV